MPDAIMLAVCLHVLAGVFWAGSTMGLAAAHTVSKGRLFFSQMAAALIAIFAGAYLWHTLHEGVFETAERYLALGAICAILALVFQVILAGPAVLKLQSGIGSADRLHTRSLIAHRVAAALLAITAICMAASRYA